jgi:serine/threonine-protein kinase
MGLCPSCLLGSALADEPEPYPYRFGGYELLAKLGEGGMGVVYEARQVRGIRRVVALKRIRDGELADAAARRRFFEEARVAVKLRHHNIVPIYEVGEHEGEPYFTMELMSGGTLAEVAARHAEPRRAAALVAKLARAVHAGHEKRIIHRDLKPGNILFDAHDEPYIADFGVAKHLDKDGSTSTGALVGTSSYMAPEQAYGQAKRDTVAADVWSLGVILYELVAGQRPFSGPTPFEVHRRVSEEEPEPLERLRPNVGRDLATACHTCLQKEPERRYISAKALADDLERCLRGEPVAARRPSRVTRAVRWCGRHPTTAALFGSAAMLLAILTFWAFAGARAQERARRDEVLAANVYAARAVAGTVLAQLDEYAGWVAKEASDPRLAEALARGNDEELRAICEVLHARHGGNTSPVGWWFVLDAAGDVHALVPPSQRSGAPRNVSYRDYFRGGMALPTGVDRSVYVSRGFRARPDNGYKVAISSPIHAEDGSILGLLVASMSTDRRFGALELSDERRIAVLTARRECEDAAKPAPDQHILLVHDDVAQGEGILVESEALRRLTARRDAARIAGQEQLKLPPPGWVEAEDDYQDPLAKPDPDGARGPWLAGIAPVGNTELAVIVQTRVGDATALDRTPFRVLAVWSVGGAVLLFAGLFAALRTRAGARRA